MSRVTLASNGSAAEVSFKRMFEEALFQMEKGFRLLSTAEQQTVAERLRHVRDQRKTAPRKAHSCNETEDVAPYSVKCQLCQKFKSHHDWPCPKFDLSKFEYLEPLGGGAGLEISTDERAYYAAPNVQYRSWQLLPVVRSRRFFDQVTHVPTDFLESEQ